MQGAFWHVAEYVCGGGAPVLPVLNVGHVLVCDRVAVVFDDDSRHYSAFCLESSCHTLSVVCPACWSPSRSRYTSAMRYVGWPWIPPAGFSWLRCTQLLNVFVLTICPVDCASRSMI